MRKEKMKFKVGDSVCLKKRWQKIFSEKDRILTVVGHKWYDWKKNKWAVVVVAVEPGLFESIHQDYLKRWKEK